jgi:magnesium transporter
LFTEAENGKMDYFFPYAVVFREGVIGFSFTSNSHPQHVQIIIVKLTDYLTITADYFCYALI